MRYRVYSVLDKAVQAFMPPMCFRAEGEAKRSFVDALAAEGSAIARHKSDYAFCFLGYFDDNLGLFESLPPVVAIEGGTAMMHEEPRWDLELKAEEVGDTLNGKGRVA